MACAPCQASLQRSLNISIPTKNVDVVKSICPKPDYLTEFEQKLVCMKERLYFPNTTAYEINILLGQIGTMNIHNNYCQYDLTEPYNRLKDFSCTQE